MNGPAEETPLVEQNVLEQRPIPVRTRFELAAHRITSQWIAAGRLDVSADDLRAAGEFLETVGTRVERVTGALRVVRHGRAREVTREGVVLLALRELASAQR